MHLLLNKLLLWGLLVLMLAPAAGIMAVALADTTCFQTGPILQCQFVDGGVIAGTVGVLFFVGLVLVAASQRAPAARRDKTSQDD